MDKQHEISTLFLDGPVEPGKITELICHYSKDKRSGACQFFLGQVRAGETSLLGLVTSEHRNEAQETCREAITRIKEQLNYPFREKELLDNQSYVWKENLR